MKQLIRKGFSQIIVDEVPDPVVTSHHVLIRPLYSLISSGTETTGIHQEGVLRAVADNPSHLTKIRKAKKETFSPTRDIVPGFAAAGCWRMLGTWLRFGKARPATRNLSGPTAPVAAGSRAGTGHLPRSVPMARPVARAWRLA
jgi:hypothetical protein